MGNAIIPFVGAGSSGSVFTTYREFNKTFTGTHEKNSSYTNHSIYISPWRASVSMIGNATVQFGLLDSTDEVQELNRQFLFPIILIESCYVTTTVTTTNAAQLYVARPRVYADACWIATVSESLEAGTAFSFSPTWAIAMPQYPSSIYYDKDIHPMRVVLPFGNVAGSFTCDIAGSIVGIEIMPK